MVKLPQREDEMSKNQVLLDGKYTDPAEINPAKHRFIGMFRPPIPPELDKWGGYCPECRSVRLHEEKPWSCWREGHFDIPQYVTIGNVEDSHALV